MRSKAGASSALARGLQILAILLCLPSASSMHEKMISNMRRQFPFFEPDNIVDVGANRGLFSSGSRPLYPNATILMLEATEMHDETLKKVAQEIGKAHYKIAVLTGTAGERVKFYQNPGAHTGNSMLLENSKHFADIRPVERISSTVDTEIQLFCSRPLIF